jgi:hypothetical protein
MMQRLLQAIETVIGGIEIRYQYAVEVLKYLSEKSSFSVRAKDIDGSLNISEYPNVTRPAVELYLSFVNMDDRTCNDPCQESLVRLAIVPGEQISKDKEFAPVDSDSEGFLEKPGEGPHSEPMRYLLVREPTHETVVILC